MARPYGTFPARRCRCRHSDTPTPEVPDGDWPRFWGACASIPTTADELQELLNTDNRATHKLTITDTGTDRNAPYFVFSCPLAYGSVSSMTTGGLSLDFDAAIMDVEGIEYRLVWTPYAQYSPLSLVFS